MLMTYFNPSGESTLTDAMTAAGKTYEEIAQMVAEQVGFTVVIIYLNNAAVRKETELFVLSDFSVWKLMWKSHVSFNSTDIIVMFMS